MTTEINRFGITKFDKFTNHWVKYLKFEFLDWGDEPFQTCLVSTVEVFGVTAENVTLKKNVAEEAKENDSCSKNDSLIERFSKLHERSQIKKELKQELSVEMHPLHELEHN